MLEPTNEQIQRILVLAGELRKIAAKVGPMHAWWDEIFDMESFAKGQPTIIKMSAGEWIADAEKLLKEHADRS